MEYKFKPLALEIENLDSLVIPDIKNREIEKRGHIITFTLNQVEENTRALLKSKKEVEGQLKLELSKLENMESYHSFIKGLTEEQIFVSGMYHTSNQLKNMCEKKLEEINKQLEEDEIEVAEIKKQLPLLVDKVTCETNEKESNE